MKQIMKSNSDVCMSSALALLFSLPLFNVTTGKFKITPWLALVAHIIFALDDTGLEYNIPFHEYCYPPFTDEQTRSGEWLGQGHQLQKPEFTF